VENKSCFGSHTCPAGVKTWENKQEKTGVRLLKLGGGFE
jgi:hypothetical protein